MFLCDICIHNCKQNKNECDNYEPMVDKEELEELNYEIRRQNLNIKRFCKKENLKLFVLKDMINGKIPFTYKYLYKINLRLNEKDEWIRYIDKYKD